MADLPDGLIAGLLRLFPAQPRHLSTQHQNCRPEPRTKILELGWMEGLVAALADEGLKRVFTSQFVENRSHINMGRRIVEECVSRPVAAELCRWACGAATRDYHRYLHELSDLVLGRETVMEVPVAPAQVHD